MTSATYCLDTSSLIHAAVRAYPMDVFGSFWTRLADLIAKGQAFAPKEVLTEIQRQDDDLHSWCKSKNGFFVPPEVEVQEAMSEVARRFPSLIDEKKGRGLADPWVVAVAQVTGATIVTQEFSKPTYPKIPDVCRTLQIRSINLLELIRQEGWTWNS